MGCRAGDDRPIWLPERARIASRRAPQAPRVGDPHRRGWRLRSPVDTSRYVRGGAAALRRTRRHDTHGSDPDGDAQRGSARRARRWRGARGLPRRSPRARRRSHRRHHAVAAAGAMPGRGEGRRVRVRRPAGLSVTERALLSGVETLARLLVLRARLDARDGLTTATMVSGYPGSPLGAFDLTLEQLEELLA